MSAVPPCFSDLGKNARDIFSKGYNYGQVKVELKTKTKQDVEIKLNGSSNNENSRVDGVLEGKMKIPDYGVTITDKWKSDNTICPEITVENQLLDGLKLTLDGTFQPMTGNKTGRIKTAYKRDNLHLNADVDLNSLNVTGAAVVGYNGWLAGCQVGFNSGKGAVQNSHFAVGYASNDFTLHSNVRNGEDFGCSLHQRVNPDLELGVDVAWNSGSNSSNFALASKYVLDKDSSVRTKVNSKGEAAFGYTRTLREGVTATFSTKLQATNFSAGGHKLGMGLEFEA